MGAYKFSGVDIEAAAGFIPSDNRATSNSLERPHDIKPVFSHEYADENGVDIDLVSPRFKIARQFRFDGHIWSTSEADYKAKKAALLAAVAPNMITIFAEEIDVTVNAMFKGFSAWERLTPVKGSDNIVTHVVIDFEEVMAVPVPEYDLFYGPVASVPDSEAEVLLLNTMEFADEFQMMTGTTHRLFVVAVQEGITIEAVTDLDGGVFSNVTGLFTLRGQVEVGIVTYDVYAMEVAVPYSSSHRLKVELNDSVE